MIEVIGACLARCFHYLHCVCSSRLSKSAALKGRHIWETGIINGVGLSFRSKDHGASNSGGIIWTIVDLKQATYKVIVWS